MFYINNVLLTKDLIRQKHVRIHTISYTLYMSMPDEFLNHIGLNIVETTKHT